MSALPIGLCSPLAALDISCPLGSVLTEEYMQDGAIDTTANRMVEGLLAAAAVELPRAVRIKCISPTVLTESVGYHAYFTGFCSFVEWPPESFCAMNTPDSEAET
jgi:hypothetical protein